MFCRVSCLVCLVIFLVVLLVSCGDKIQRVSFDVFASFEEFMEDQGEGGILVLSMVNIMSLEDGAVFVVGEFLVVIVEVSDDWDSFDMFSFSWSSNFVGVFLGAVANVAGLSQFEIIILSVGEYIITFEVTDSDGLSGKVFIIIFINVLSSVLGVGIILEELTIMDDLVVSVMVLLSDSNRDSSELSYCYCWYKNG